MPLHHVIAHQQRRFYRRYPFLRCVSIATTLLTLLWLYLIHWGERAVYAEHVDACHWEEWEDWPHEAQPHHLVFIADPQLVDPHTYPGRPWPLDMLTERYTDLYMARNFRLMNYYIDPDTIMFLGDLFDGGREWAPEVPKKLKESQEKLLEDLGIRVPKEAPHETPEQLLAFPGIHGEGSRSNNQARSLPEEEKASQPQPEQRALPGQQESSPPQEEKREERVPSPEEQMAGAINKRSLATYKAALTRPHSHEVTREEHNIGKDGRDLKVFVPGDPKWSKWGNEQWLKDLRRFSRIFFDPEQLYPYQERELFAMYDVTADPISIQNGASSAAWKEYATVGGRQRRVISSLPGNHDLGFGPGVQLPIRDRFRSHFGEGNRLDVIGNHTIVSLDTPSLAAHSYFQQNGYETDTEQEEYKHLWLPGMQFMEQMRAPARKAVAEALREFYPNQIATSRWHHEVTDTELVIQPSAAEIAEEQNKPKPNLPVILLSHVPLFRPQGTDCGPLRERDNAIKIQIGYQYQNVLTQGLSKDIITKISETAGKIVQIFSGDDHNYCDVQHRYNVAVDFADIITTEMAHIREITVKTFSWAMGVRWPAFVMVSLWNPVDKDGISLGKKDEPTIQTHLCLLPSQLGIFLDYTVFLMITVIVLIADAVYWSPRVTASLGTEDNPLSPRSEQRMSLPRFKLGGMNGSTHGSSSSSGSGGGSHYGSKPPGAASSRQRGTSTSSSSHSRSNSGYHLSVQRSFTARTRSISPPLGGPLVTHAGYYPPARWPDPAYDDSDEESHLSGQGGDDSQAKWKWRQRTQVRMPDKLRKSLVDLVFKLWVVGIPASLYYFLLVRSG